MSGQIKPIMKGLSIRDDEFLKSEDTLVLKLKLSPCSFGLKIRLSWERSKMLPKSSNDK